MTQRCTQLDEHCTIAKLTDFGLAKIKKATNATKTKEEVAAAGTLHYMAPELFGLKPRYSQASDVYAYGLLAW